MDMMAQLRGDHAQFRAKLGTMEHALRAGPEAWFVLGELCVSLCRQIEEHIRREEEAMQAYRPLLALPLRLRLAAGHHEEPAWLHALHARLLVPEGSAYPQVAAMLQALIRSLRDHMEEEETMMFPTLEHAIGAPGALQADEHAVDETTTVNRLVQYYPDAKPVLQRLHINVPMEGCTCLDELAWRHGMDYRDLLGALRDALGEEVPPEERSPLHG